MFASPKRLRQKPGILVVPRNELLKNWSHVEAVESLCPKSAFDHADAIAQ